MKRSSLFSLAIILIVLFIAFSFGVTQGIFSSLDKAVFHAVTLSPFSGSYIFMKSVSFLASAPFLIVVSLLLLLFFIRQKMYLETLFFSFCALSGIIFGELLKFLFAILRPVNPLEIGWSFPSEHAVLALVIYGALLMIYYHSSKKVLLPYVFLILLIGYSRLALGVHWLSDVIGGYILGGIILSIGYFFLVLKKPKKSLSKIPSRRAVRLRR